MRLSNKTSNAKNRSDPTRFGAMGIYRIWNFWCQTFYQNQSF